MKSQVSEICINQIPIKPIWTGVFLGQSWTGGGADLAPPHPPHYLSPGTKDDNCDNFSEFYFEVYNISVASNLMILETILRFC